MHFNAQEKTTRRNGIYFWVVNRCKLSKRTQSVSANWHNYARLPAQKNESTHPHHKVKLMRNRRKLSPHDAKQEQFLQRKTRRESLPSPVMLSCSATLSTAHITTQSTHSHCSSITHHNRLMSSPDSHQLCSQSVLETLQVLNTHHLLYLFSVITWQLLWAGLG